MDNQVSSMKKEIESYDGNRLLNTSETDLIDYFVKKYSIQPINLLKENMYVDQEEVEVDVSHDRSRILLDERKPYYVKGTKITLFVPFEGEEDLFDCLPSSFTTNPPRGYIQSNILRISISTTNHDSKSVQKNLNKELNNIEKYINWIDKDIKPWNESLTKKAKGMIDSRRDKLLKDRELIDELDFPIKRREDEESTYVAPEVRRKVTPKPLEATNEPYQPEPVLDMKEYEHIIE